MRASFLVAVATLAGVAVFAAGNRCLAVMTGPSLVCDEPVYDFGTRDNESPVSHDFILHNTGTNTVTITQVRPACGCTVASLHQKVVPPGGATVLSTTLSLRGRQGEQNKSIAVESNDPVRPTLTLMLSGAATTEFSFVPAYVNFGELTEQQDAVQSVRLTCRRPGVAITDATCDSAAFKVQIWPKGDPRGTGLDVRTVPPLPSGYLRANITVVTDHPSHPRASVSLFGTVIGEVTVMPSEIVLRTSVSEPVTRAILVRGGQVKDYKILEVDAPLKDIVTQVTKYGPGMYRIDLRDLTPSPELKDKALRILTDLPKNKEIRIPFRLSP